MTGVKEALSYPGRKLGGVSIASAAVALLFSAPAQEAPRVPGVVDQRDYPDSRNACAPASILNLLKFSSPEYQEVYQSLLGADEGIKMRFVVDRYFKNRPSVTYPNQERWGVHGIQSADLVAGLNELLADKGAGELRATYLDRGEGESGRNHLARVHGLVSASVKNGVMPILSLRSFRVRVKDGKAEGWESAQHHNVVVIAVKRPPSSTGFELEVLDPWKGRSLEVFLHREANEQAFRALKGIEEEGLWLAGAPFLQVIAPEMPTLRPADLGWSERFLVVANFLVGDF